MGAQKAQSRHSAHFAENFWPWTSGALELPPWVAVRPLPHLAQAIHVLEKCGDHAE